ncbi:hypothetical protein GCM10023149_31010 [Mucilaginibacter gynuensis]|uniref:Uncharacterized protein n=1 Tax=Mucilaginibacter gynuensis TaxID=1302236 RepID=A0ABP8GNC6_9SPHI
MSYANAKTSFEAAVKSLQAELQRYVDSGKASQRAVDVKTDIINKLVEFYQSAEEQIHQLQAEKDATVQQYNKLHTDAAKLVLFSSLCGINPNMALHYQRDELTAMYSQGLRIRLPVADLSKDDAEPPSEKNITEMLMSDNLQYHHDKKYTYLNQFCRK